LDKERDFYAQISELEKVGYRGAHKVLQLDLVKKL